MRQVLVERHDTGVTIHHSIHEPQTENIQLPISFFLFAFRPPFCSLRCATFRVPVSIARHASRNARLAG
jgi:hypothetical protein